jgi:hypothetical protein
MSYDSSKDTWTHILRVRELLDQVKANIERRKLQHDLSKLNDPEKSYFDEFTPKLAETAYGTDEYEAMRAAMKPGLDHHYAANDHHPEHYVEGIKGMSLFSLIEMIPDWKAAGERQGGNIYTSIEKNQERFGYSDELKQIFINTAREFGW